MSSRRNNMLHIEFAAAGLTLYKIIGGMKAVLKTFA